MDVDEELRDYAKRINDRFGDAEQFFDARTKCYVLAVHYDATSRWGRLHIGWGGCCDMKGCIALFKAIDAKVESIDTFSSGERDTGYRLVDGKWHAIEAKYL